MTSCDLVPESAARGMPLAESPASKPTWLPSFGEIWPLGNGNGPPPVAPQNSACNRPNVWPSSWPQYQSPYEPSVSHANPFAPVGPDATVEGSGVVVGTPEARPRMKFPPPASWTSP